MKLSQSYGMSLAISLSGDRLHCVIPYRPYGITQCYLSPDTSEHTPP